MRTKFKAKEQARREERVEFANVQAARAEVSYFEANSNFQFKVQVLTAEDAGLLEGDEEQEFTGQIKQQQIRWDPHLANSYSITSSGKLLIQRQRPKVLT